MSAYNGNNNNRIAPNSPRRPENPSYGQPGSQRYAGSSQERSFGEDQYAPKKSGVKVAFAVAAALVVLVGAGLGFFILSDDGQDASQDAQATASSLAVSDKASDKTAADKADDKADSKDKDKKSKKDKAKKKKKSKKDKDSKKKSKKKSSDKKKSKKKSSATTDTKKKKTKKSTDSADSKSQPSSSSDSSSASSTDSGSKKKPAKKPSSSPSSTEPSSSQGDSSASDAPVQQSGIAVQCSIDSSRASGYGASMGSGSVTLEEGATAYDALCAMGVSVGGNSTYVSSINGLAEKTNGAMSGWMYSVNGVFPNKACGKYVLSDGDVVEWVYTCNLGKDL